LILEFKKPWANT